MLTRDGSTRAWRVLRAAILTRDEGLCQVPGADGQPCLAPAAHVDHVLPRSRGGQDDPGNLRAACRECNMRRGADPMAMVRTWSWT